MPRQDLTGMTGDLLMACNAYVWERGQVLGGQNIRRSVRGIKQVGSDSGVCGLLALGG